ncbi:hypothetical protein B0I37DRAFT_408294 [Chaetomium sp. MPI-CAGE-AT-0009]|nr:hypothetical protein B0I37DRAFT_408294 [Chaetomium sp. MPI-CAGE-AT-0009]
MSSSTPTAPADGHNDHDDAANDIDGCIYPAIREFYTKFFETKPWSSAAETLVQGLGEGVSDLSGVRSRDAFATWLSQFQSHLPGDLGARYTWLENGRGVSASSHKALILSQQPNAGVEPGCERHGHWAVFAHQPSRLFVHAFYICGGKLELWVFDRSALYEAEWGVSGLIQEDSKGKFTECGGEDNTASKRLDLAEPPIFARVNKDIVSDGLTCYRARPRGSDRWDYVVKLKCATASDKSEVKMLQLAKERNIAGVLQLFSHETVFSTDALHHGLQLVAPRELRRHDAVALVSDNPGSALENTVEVEGRRGTGNKIFSCIIVSPLGESLHRFQAVPELLIGLRDGIKAHRSLYQDAGILHQDICPGNIIVSSPGANAAPRGVLIDLDSAKMASEPGKQFEGIGTPPFQAIGVLQAYLPNNPHTYRHDLESFLYTFLFLATCQRPVPAGLNQLQLPPASRLYQWTQGRPVDQARRKTSDMSVENFGGITAEFTPEFQHLQGFAERLRKVLFPVRDDEVWTGTDMTAEGTDALYGAMISAFEEVIDVSIPSL